MNKLNIEELITYAKETFGLTITVRKSKEPVTFERIFGIRITDTKTDCTCTTNKRETDV